MICPDLSVDKDGNYVSLEDTDLKNAAASLDVLLGMRRTDVYSEDQWYRDVGPYMVLEKDRYTLRDMKVSQPVNQSHSNNHNTSCLSILQF